MKKIKSLLFFAFVMFLFVGCNKATTTNPKATTKTTTTTKQTTKKMTQENVNIVFTNDIHCGVDDNLGYSKLKAYVDELRENNKYVTVVDSGDFTQGSILGTLTNGEAMIDIMNEIGYDYATFGNHEFDYGIDQLEKLVKQSDFKYLYSNIKYTGSKEHTFLDDSFRYDIKEYGGIKIGYIGISTPDTISNSTPAFFKEDGKYVYEFGIKGDSYSYIDEVQKVVDEIKDKTDYIVCLGHLGYTEGEYYSISSNCLAENTTGIDVILDGHSHEIYNSKTVKNKEGKDVYISQTGTKLANFGHLIINENGIKIEMVDSFDRLSESMNKLIDDKNKENEELLNKIVCNITSDITINDEDGVRMVRNRETPIGNLTADAYRVIMNADIGIVNGGGVRAGLEKGDVTYADIISVNPYGNMLCVVEVTGQEILDILEALYSMVESEYKTVSGETIGENGSFACISGLKCTIDTSIDSPAVFSEAAGNPLLKIEGERRVKDAKILQDGQYVDIDINKTYTMASHDYMIKDGGMGMEYFLANHNIVADNNQLDYQVLITYIVDVLNKDVSQYYSTDGRINVI